MPIPPHYAQQDAPKKPNIKTPSSIKSQTGNKEASVSKTKNKKTNSVSNRSLTKSINELTPFKDAVRTPPSKISSTADIPDIISETDSLHSSTTHSARTLVQPQSLLNSERGSRKMTTSKDSAYTRPRFTFASWIARLFRRSGTSAKSIVSPRRSTVPSDHSTKSVSSKTVAQQAQEKPSKVPRSLNLKRSSSTSDVRGPKETKTITRLSRESKSPSGKSQQTQASSLPPVPSAPFKHEAVHQVANFQEDSSVTYTSDFQQQFKNTRKTKAVNLTEALVSLDPDITRGVHDVDEFRRLAAANSFTVPSHQQSYETARGVVSSNQELILHKVKILGLSRLNNSDIDSVIVSHISDQQQNSDSNIGKQKSLDAARESSSKATKNVIVPTATGQTNNIPSKQLVGKIAKKVDQSGQQSVRQAHPSSSVTSLKSEQSNYDVRSSVLENSLKRRDDDDPSSSLQLNMPPDQNK